MVIWEGLTEVVIWVVIWEGLAEEEERLCVLAGDYRVSVMCAPGCSCRVEGFGLFLGCPIESAPEAPGGRGGA